MLAQHRSVLLPRPIFLTIVSLLALVTAVAALAELDGQPRAGATELDGPPARATLPVHEPDEWEFWDQMAAAFSVEPVPSDLAGGPGVVFRWWLDRTYVGGDVVPQSCTGLELWYGELERYGFEDGAAFVASRSGPCAKLAPGLGPHASVGATMGALGMALASKRSTS